MAKPLPKTDYQDLERLYSGREGADPSRLEQRPPGSWWRRLLVIGCVLIVVVSAIAWLGFYVFSTWSRPAQGQLEVGIEAPSAVAAGEPLTYRLTLTNHTSDALQNIRLRTNYPDGFVWQNATPPPDGQSRNSWTLPSLSPGEPKVIEVQGLLLGESGTVSTLFVAATYSMPNFQSELETSSSIAIKLDPSRVQITWNGPTQASPDSDAEYKIHYEYDGESVLPDGNILVLAPTTFTIAKATPSLGPDNQLQWSVKGLTKGGKGDIVLSGHWSKDGNGDQRMKASLVAKASNDTVMTIGASEFTTALSGGDLTLSLSANDSTTPTAASLGSTVHWVLTYKNTSEHTMSGVEVRVAFNSGGYVDWARLDKILRLQEQTISWESANTPSLATIPPQSGGTLTWDTPLVSTASNQNGTWTITATPSLEHRTLDNVSANRTYAGVPLSVSVSTSAVLDVEARYFDASGTPLGSGPLPPVVNEETTYEIEWKLSGTVHPLGTVVVQGDLPSQVVVVEGSGTASFGSLDLSSPTHPVWRIPSLESGLEPSATFTVKLTPTSSDVGRILVLSGKTVLTATDNTTAGPITVAGTTATTNLDTDSVARGKGVVAKQ